jgi:hypothetical protein
MTNEMVEEWERALCQTQRFSELAFALPPPYSLMLL